MRTIAATTWGEYKKYFEKDPALTRRFQVIKVEEPSEERAVLMIRGLSPVLEKHHKVDVLDEALVAAAQLSHRYIPARQLPDKAVSLIDTACARVAISQHATPPEVEDSRRRVSALEVERKQVTVLFCDLTNSTALAERLGPEAMHTLLNHFWYDLVKWEAHIIFVSVAPQEPEIRWINKPQPVFRT